MSKPGGVKILHLQFNVLIQGVCNGCDFHKFPYKTQSIIRNKNGNFDSITFESMEDIWEYIMELKNEASELSNSNNILLKDVFYQIPFFSCNNIYIDDGFQKDISKYLYCQDTKTPPYPGSYGSTPAIWKEKHFAIKQAMSILNQEVMKQAKKKQKEKHGIR